MKTIQTILHPTDFSESSRFAFAVACSLARDHEARLVVLHVMYPSSAPIPESPLPNPLEPAERQEAIFGRLPWPEPEEGIRVEHRVAEGDAVGEILSLADHIGCDLIVMGTHGRTGLRRVLAGSVAERTLREADCPVLTVRAPFRSRPPSRAVSQVRPGDVVDLREPIGSELVPQPVRRDYLYKTAGVEMARILVPAGAEMSDPGSHNDLIVQCLTGKIACTLLGDTKTLDAGELMHLPARESRRIKAIEDSSLLITTLQDRSNELQSEMSNRDCSLSQ